MGSMRRIWIGAAVSLLALAARPLNGRAGEAASRERDEEAIRQTAAAYVEAVNRGDLRAVAEFWTEEGDFVDEADRMGKGRTLAAQEQIDAERNKTLTATLNSVRFVTADVAIVDGIARLAPVPPGGPPMNHFTAVWVRSGGRWLLDAVRESAVSAEPSHHDRLKEIEWLLGDWAAEGDGPRLRLSSRWSADGNFILREIRLGTDDGREHSLSQRIGWDPRTGRLKSWTFDDRGGYGESLWARDGERWVVESRGVLPGGQRISGTHVYSPVDSATFIWESLDAKLDGEALPDSKRTIVRIETAR